MLFWRKNNKIKTKLKFNRLNFCGLDENRLFNKEKPKKQETCLSGYFKNVKGLIRF